MARKVFSHNPPLCHDEDILFLEDNFIRSFKETTPLICELFFPNSVYDLLFMTIFRSQGHDLLSPPLCDPLLLSLCGCQESPNTLCYYILVLEGEEE